LRTWLVVLGIAILLVDLIVGFTRITCHGGIEHVTVTNSNGSTSTMTLIETPVCGYPNPLTYLGVAALIVSILLIATGVILKKS
jgi:hypothetical protein